MGLRPRARAYQNINETTLFKGRVLSSLKLFAQAKLRLIDSCQNGTCADHYQKTNNVGSGTRSGISPLRAGLKCLTLTVDSPFCSNIRYHNESQMTAVKLEHPLAVITWLYNGVFFLPIEVTYFFKFSSNILVDHGQSRDRTPIAWPSPPQAYQCLISHVLASLGACSLILYIHVTIMSWSVDSCQNSVSAD